MKVIRPSDNPISRGYIQGHHAYDFRGLNLPDEVYCGMDGKIIQRVDEYTTNWSNTGTLTTKDYGNYVKIQHTDGTSELHAHLRKSSSLNLNTQVKAGQIVARIGNTGNSTGKHLHAEYRTKSNINTEVEFITMTSSNDVTITKTRHDELLIAESLLGEFRSNGYGSATEVKQMEQDKNKAIEDLRTELSAEKLRAEEARKTYNDLLALAAEELGTQQEPNQIKVELSKISEKLDELADLHRNYASLQLDSGKREEELRAEIKVLQERIKQVMADKMPLSKYELKELLIEISRRLLNIIKLSR